MTFKLLHRLAALKFHVMHLAVARDLDLKPFADRVHAFRADAVRAAGKFVAALAVFAAGVQRRQNQLDAGNFVLRMNVHRNAAAVVADGNRAVHVDRHLDLVAVAGEMFVHGIIQHFAHAMMQRALVRAADIHAGLLAHGLEPFEFAELRRVVNALRILVWRSVFFFRSESEFFAIKIGHADVNLVASDE